MRLCGINVGDGALDIPKIGRWARAFGRFVNRPYAGDGKFCTHKRLCGIIDIVKPYVSQPSRRGYPAGYSFVRLAATRKENTVYKCSDSCESGSFLH